MTNICIAVQQLQCKVSMKTFPWLTLPLDKVFSLSWPVLLQFLVILPHVRLLCILTPCGHYSLKTHRDDMSHWLILLAYIGDAYNPIQQHILLSECGWTTRVNFHPLATITLVSSYILVWTPILLSLHFRASVRLNWQTSFQRIMTESLPLKWTLKTWSHAETLEII